MENDPSVPVSGLSSSASHRRTQRSTTLNRKYVKKPSSSSNRSASVKSSESAALDSVAKRRADDLRRRQELAEKINRERLATLRSGRSLQPSVSAAAPAPTKQERPVISAPRPLSATIEKNLAASGKDERSSKEIKDSAVQSALKSVASMNADSAPAALVSSKGSGFGVKRIALAFACAAVVVGIIGFTVSQSTPDLSVRVAAMQSGIDASYPGYVPRGYALSDIVSEEGKLAMTFSASDGTSFELSEEKSAWDNDTLETNYVKSTWGSNYTSIREQGITIYISGSNAAWTNGGIVYKLKASGNNLTKKQIKAIVTSL